VRHLRVMAWMCSSSAARAVLTARCRASKAFPSKMGETVRTSNLAPPRGGGGRGWERDGVNESKESVCRNHSPHVCDDPLLLFCSVQAERRSRRHSVNIPYSDRATQTVSSHAVTSVPRTCSTPTHRARHPTLLRLHPLAPTYIHPRGL
jgi:hypothetical protein